jgi:hypothetical protein
MITHALDAVAVLVCGSIGATHMLAPRGWETKDKNDSSEATYPHSAAHFRDESGSREMLMIGVVAKGEETVTSVMAKG